MHAGNMNREYSKRGQHFNRFCSTYSVEGPEVNSSEQSRCPEPREIFRQREPLKPCFSMYRAAGSFVEGCVSRAAATLKTLEAKMKKVIASVLTIAAGLALA